MRLVELLFELTAKWHRWEEEFARSQGLTVGMISVLMRLDVEESICAKNLAGRIDLSFSRSSRLIEQMVVQGLLIRDCDPEDRRRCTLRLTEEAIRIRKLLWVQMDRLQDQLQDEGEFCDWSRLIRLIDKLHDQLKKKAC